MENDESVFDTWSSSSEEFEHEAFYEPTILGVRNLDPSISETDIKSFFSNIAEPEVDIYKTRDEEGDVVGSVAVMKFSSLEQTQAAMKLKGENLQGNPAYLVRWSSSLFTACVVGFDPMLSDNDLKQRFSAALGSIGTADKPESVGNLIRTFIPRSTSNGASLGFCYLYIQTDDKNEVDFKSCLERVDPNIGQISHVNLKHWVNESLLVSNNERILIEKVERRIKAIEESRQQYLLLPFSWKERPELFAFYEQNAFECWAIALYKGHYAARNIAGPSQSDPDLEAGVDAGSSKSDPDLEAGVDAGSSQSVPDLEVEKIEAGVDAGSSLSVPDLDVDEVQAGVDEVQAVVDEVQAGVMEIYHGVDPRHLMSGMGIDSVKNALPFMSKHGKGFKIHYRPTRHGNEEDFETFATNTIRLARRVPVSVMIKLPPSYLEWNFATQGTYIPSVTDLCRLPFEKDPEHGLLIAAGAVEDGLQVLEFQDSFGLEHGAQGFIKLAFFKYLLKEVYEF